MFRVAVIASLLAFACGATPRLRPVLGFGEAPIIGGEEVDIKDAAYQVALQYDPTGTSSFGLRCGGTILTNFVILTAGHCTSGTIAGRWRVRTGSSYHASGGTTHTVTKVTTHVNYNSNTIDYDIGILTTSYITIDDSTTRLATLPNVFEEVEVGANAVVTGWGTTVSGGSTLSTVLRRVTLPIVDQGVCVDAFHGINQVTDRMICAGYMGTGGMDACDGDSGGPLIVDGILIGITSWGVDCALANYPGVWTRVPIFVQWIVDNLS